MPKCLNCGVSIDDSRRIALTYILTKDSGNKQEFVYDFCGPACHMEWQRKSIKRHTDCDITKPDEFDAYCRIMRDAASS